MDLSSVQEFKFGIKISKLAGGLSSAQHLKTITLCIQKDSNRRNALQDDRIIENVEQISKFEVQHLVGTSEGTSCSFQPTRR